MDSKTKVSNKAVDTMSQDRRDFLEIAGKVAVYTPPVMLGLLLPGQHAIASGGVGDPPVGC